MTESAIGIAWKTRNVRAGRSTAAISFIASLPLTSCVTLPDRVSIPAAPQGCASSVCQLGIAKTYASDTENKMMAALKTYRDDRDALRVVSFLGALATAGAASFGGGRDLTLALGLGTGTAGVAASLTTARGYGRTYLAAADAAACVVQAIATVETAAVTVQDSRPVLVAAEATLNGLSTLSPEDVNARDVAGANARIVLARADEFDMAGIAFASRSRSAVYNIVTKARQQIIAQEPDETTFKEAMGIVGGLAVAPPAANFKTKAPDPALKGGLAIVTSDKDKLVLREQQRIIDRRGAVVDSAITGAVTDATTQLASCAGLQAVQAPQPLVVSGAPDGAVTIGKDTNISLALSGGDVGYRGTWVGVVPKDLTLSQQGNVIDITAGSTLVAGQKYLLRMRDLATQSQSKDIAVTTK